MIEEILIFIFFFFFSLDLSSSIFFFVLFLVSSWAATTPWTNSRSLFCCSYSMVFQKNYLVNHFKRKSPGFKRSSTPTKSFRKFGENLPRKRIKNQKQQNFLLFWRNWIYICKIAESGNGNKTLTATRRNFKF